MPNNKNCLITTTYKVFDILLKEIQRITTLGYLSALHNAKHLYRNISIHLKLKNIGDLKTSKFL